MLRSNHGASALARTFRRPQYLTTTLNSLEGDSATTSRTENLHSATTRMGGRALSSPARANSTPSSNRTWSPNHTIVFGGTWSPNQGIVFRPAAATPRSMTMNAVESIKQDHLLHSQAEDGYVIASADMTVLKHQSSLLPKATTPADSEEPPPPIPKKSRELKIPRVAKAKVAESKYSGPEAEQEDPQQNELPQTTTTLKMTEELFRKAKNAELGSPESYWSHTLYRGPVVNGVARKTTVHYCKRVMTTERVLKTYFSDSEVVGFDIEWSENAHRNSDAKQNVSLIQIANEERIALFHVASYPQNELVAPTFKKIMEDNKITKVGVSIKADCTRLRKHLGIDSQGILELSHLYKLVKYSSSKQFGEINRQLVSLAKQTKEHLHLPIFKGDVRTSDWSKSLSLDQIRYAASDSYAGLQLFHTLEMKRKDLNPTPPRPYHAELDLPIRIAEGVEIPSHVEAEEEDPAERTSTNTTAISPTEIKTRPEKSSKREMAAASGII